MDNNLNVNLQKTYIEINKINEEINNKVHKFITESSELVESSKNIYQIEKTTKLNKISLKGYILDSPCCKNLKENNISNYSIEELKRYLFQYEKNANDDCSQYYLAISLYESIEEIERLTDNKMNLEINKISELLPTINNVKTINNNYESLYNEIKNELNYCFDKKILDDKSYKICLQIINDIFNYYIKGTPILI